MIIKSKPLAIPNKRANELLKLGKIANRLTKTQNADHNRVVVKEFFSFKYLNRNHTIAIIDINGNKTEYSNI